MLKWPEKDSTLPGFGLNSNSILWFKVSCPQFTQVYHCHRSRRKGKDSEKDFLLHTYMWKEKHPPSQLCHTVNLNGIPIFPSCAWLPCFLEQKQTLYLDLRFNLRIIFPGTQNLGVGRPQKDKILGETELKSYEEGCFKKGNVTFGGKE